jgi:hypothetical protein
MDDEGPGKIKRERMMEERGNRRNIQMVEGGRGSDSFMSPLGGRDACDVVANINRRCRPKKAGCAGWMRARIED